MPTPTTIRALSVETLDIPLHTPFGIAGGAQDLARNLLATVELAVWWLSVPLYVLELHAAVGLGLYVFSLWDVHAGPRAQPVRESSLRVAVLIPTWNEPTEVLAPTIAAGEEGLNQ